MSMNLPKPIADFVEANSRLDIDGMLKPFQRDAVCIDNGKHFEGQVAIRKLCLDYQASCLSLNGPRHDRGDDHVNEPTQADRRLC